SYRSKFGDETLMQFLEVSPIFAREDSGRGVAAVFEGWVNLIYWSWHWDAHAQELHRLHAWESQIAVPVLFIPPFADISQGDDRLRLISTEEPGTIPVKWLPQAQSLGHARSHR